MDIISHFATTASHSTMSIEKIQKDSMKSTWRTQSKDNWNIHHWLIDTLNVHHVDLNEPVPVHSKDEKVPYLLHAPQHVWIMTHALIPMVLHELWCRWTGCSLSGLGVVVLYFHASTISIVRETHILRLLGHRYGFLDGDKHERDGVPDIGVAKVTAALFKTIGSRIAMITFLTYIPTQSPGDVLMSWRWWLWLGLSIGIYPIVLDFWFYCYHRSMHEVSFLWKLHRTHHLTKHPNALLSAYADHEQEFFDMVVIPLLTYLSLRAMGLQLGFYDWWICHQYIVYTEVSGHSGIRLHCTPPSTLNWLLRIFSAELALEDHDLHHRKGWRHSHNYGKQTRVWDRLFGTCGTRIESASSNIDYELTARIPIF